MFRIVTNILYWHVVKPGLAAKSWHRLKTLLMEIHGLFHVF